MDNFLDFVDSLANDAVVTRAATVERFPCGQCAGSGLWSGGTNRNGNNKCIACKGKGYFLNSKADRNKASLVRRAAKEKARNRGIEIFAERHPDMFAELESARKYGSNNNFVTSLSESLQKYGSLTDGQIAAWYRGKAKLEAIKVERAAKDAAAPEVDLSGIRDMFETAVGNGYKRPTYRAEGLVISRATDHGNNPGALYVKDEEDNYCGKVLGVKYSGTRAAPTDVSERLATIAADPLGAALRYGRRTGQCACCGRKLTNHGSIDLGIGPICKDKWGL